MILRSRTATSSPVGAGARRPLARLAILGVTASIGVGLACTADWRQWSVVVAQDRADDDQAEDAVSEDGAAYLPTDRASERRLDVARRLIADQRWSDAVTLLDEILANDRDSFFKSNVESTTWRSIKAEAGSLISGLPSAGRDAYQLQFRAKADRQLAESLAVNDDRAVAAVARRWLHTPAGQRATLLAAINALDQGQPLAAAAWLDRLAGVGSGEFEPTLSVMRAVAWQRAGNADAAAEILDRARTGKATAMRLGGQDVSVSFAPGGGEAWLASVVGPPPEATVRAAEEWSMHRGDPPRNAIVAASRPLLVPRYRVPLTRHPEEAKWLESRRKQTADRDGLLLPAATPIAVDGTIMVHTPMGLLAVDFETGKRLWLQSGGAAGPVTISEHAGDEDEPAAAAIARGRVLAPVFEDATSGTLASDGRLVFAVESHPDALVGRDLMGPQERMMFNGNASPRGWNGGNSLAAYDLADHGRLRWRLPAADPGRPTRASAWTLGAPLPVGDRLFVLVEELGEVRLEVLDAATGSTVWTQPLAELDEEVRVENSDNQFRRVAGLSPALAEGVLVCPTGAGAVVAVDLATRTLLWAYNYAMSTATAGDMVVMRNGVRVPRVGRIINGRMVIGPEQAGGPEGHWLDGCPVLAGGRVVLTPRESDRLHCLDLRTGAVLWTRPREDGLYVVGVVGDRLLIGGRRGVEAVDPERGERVWFTPLTGEGAAISGRGLLVADRMFVPLDTPEVVEIELAAGRIVGRSPGRGGALPGNLVAYRGEVLSLAVDSLDVFHQTAPLESRIETALRGGPTMADEAWPLLWRGQLRLDRGDVAGGLADLRAAAAVAPGQIPPDMLPAALVHALERAPSLASALWPELLRLDPPPAIAARGLRLAVDALLASGDISQAWETCRHLIGRATDVGEEDALVPDGRDPHLTVREPRWIGSRVAAIHSEGSEDVRESVDAFAAATRRAINDREGLRLRDRRERMERFIEWFGGLPQAVAARRDLVDLLNAEAQEGGADEAALRSLAARQDFAVIQLARWGSADDRRMAAAEWDRSRAAWGALSDVRVDEAWPRGRVRVAAGKAVSDADGRRPQPMRTLPLRVAAGGDALLAGARLEFDMQRGGLIVRDSLGHTVGEPIAIPQHQHRGFGMGGFNAASADVTIVGRVVILQSGGSLAAYELAAPSTLGIGTGHRHLWTHEAGQTPRGMATRRGINGIFPRDGNVPLGMPIPEPNPGGVVAPGSVPATTAGVAVLVDRTLQVCDPLTGAVLWERHRLPEVATLFGDEEYLCLCPSSGREALVLSMATGQVVRKCDLPDRERRLLTHGRHVFTLVPRASSTSTSGRQAAEMVELEVIDPTGMERVPLGTFSGASRATLAGEKLAILEPSGSLTMIDLNGRRVVFSTRLPEMPAGLERLVVVPWQDRYLVIVGRQKTAAEARHLEKIGTISPLPQMRSPNMLGDGQPLTGSIWAVDGRDGEMLWPAPATILNHCLCANEVETVPVLLFARQIETRRGGERPRLSVLCLDKRTGAALHIDDTILAPQHMLFGCDLIGDPANHVVSVVPLGPGTTPLDLHFTGESVDAVAPYRAADHPVVAGDMATELEYWWHRLLTLPLPF